MADDEGNQGDGLVEAAAFRTEDEARSRAADLVLRGIGPEVRRVEHTDEETGITVVAFQLLVTPYDHRRAQEMLGLVEPLPVPMGDDDNPPVLEKLPVPWGKVAVIWLAALIIIPVVAFALTYFTFSR